MTSTGRLQGKHNVLLREPIGYALVVKNSFARWEGGAPCSRKSDPEFDRPDVNQENAVPAPKPNLSSSIWLIVAGLVVITALGLFSNGGGGGASGSDVIPYSEFQQYLDGGKVKQVRPRATSSVAR